MTRDFRQQGPKQIGSAAGSDMTRESSRRIVINALMASALVFLCAGVWLFAMEQSIFPPELAVVLGPVLILVAIFDIIAARFLKRFWTRQSG